MTQSGYLLIGLTAVVGGLIAVLVFTVMSVRSWVNQPPSVW